jgi:hypothetical protein
MVPTIPVARTHNRLRRLLTCLTAASLAVLVTPALAHARASITVTAHTDPAGSSAVFTYHLTGPTCHNRPPTNVTLQLHDGQSAVVPLCRGQLFNVTQDALPGWTLTKIQCVATPPDTQDPFIIDVAHSRAGVELSPDEHKACSFTNTPVSTPPVTPPTPPTTPPGGGVSPSPPASGTVPTAQQPAPQQAVSPVRVAAARAVLSATESCTTQTVTVTVRGRHVRSVAFSVNGRRIRTIRARTGQQRFTVKLPARTAVNRVVARVTFSSAASPRTRTLRKTVRRCTPSALRPNFTG